MLFKLGWLSALVVLMVISMPASAAAPFIDVTHLNVDFDHRIADSILGEGGPQVGEPVSNQGLSGVIISRGLGDNFLLVDDNSGNSFGKVLLWEFHDDAEQTAGTVQVSFRFTPSALDVYSFGVRESGGSTKNFMNIGLSATGSIFASDANGYIAESSGTYVAETELFVVLDFNMDAGTSRMRINGNTIFSGRLHGVTGRGIGRVITGYGYPNFSHSFELDDLLVSGQVPANEVFEDGFEQNLPE